MEPATTQHDRTLAELVRERSNYVDHTNDSPLAAHIMNLSEEEGHVFDHEPGMSDYHHDHLHNPEHTRHQEYYAEAHYPVNLEHDPSDYNHQLHTERNDAEANPLYHAWAYYQPQQSHDWMLHTRENTKHTFDDLDEFEFRNGADENGIEADSLDFLGGLRRMSFEGLTDHDRVTKEMKAAMTTQPCKCVHGMEECCEYEKHEREDLLEYFEAPTIGQPYHRAHYCLTGDEPECDHLRKEEKDDQDKRRKQMDQEKKK